MLKEEKPKKTSYTGQKEIHDANNELSIAIGYSQLLLNTLDKDSKEFKWVGKIGESSKRLKILIEELRKKLSQ